MSGFLLDTNVTSELIRPEPNPTVKTWLAAQTLDVLFISAVSFGEFRKGIVLRSPGKRRDELEAWIETDLSNLFSDAFYRSRDPLPSGGEFWKGSGNLPGSPSICPMVRSRPQRWSIA